MIEEIDKEYTWEAAKVRGVVLNEITTMERMMDEFICRYFCVDIDKRKELMDMIMCTKRITFDSKIDLLKEILLRRYPEWKIEINKIAEIVKAINSERNMIAHYILDVSVFSFQRFLKDRTTITFLKFDKIRTIEVFDKKRVTELLTKTHAVSEMFDQFFKLDHGWPIP